MKYKSDSAIRYLHTKWMTRLVHMYVKWNAGIMTQFPSFNNKLMDTSVRVRDAQRRRLKYVAQYFTVSKYRCYWSVKLKNRVSTSDYKDTYLRQESNLDDIMSSIVIQLNIFHFALLREAFDETIILVSTQEYTHTSSLHTIQNRVEVPWKCR